MEWYGKRNSGLVYTYRNTKLFELVRMEIWPRK
jgi:hypothetical protein